MELITKLIYLNKKKQIESVSPSFFSPKSVRPVWWLIMVRNLKLHSNAERSSQGSEEQVEKGELLNRAFN